MRIHQQILEKLTRQGALALMRHRFIGFERQGRTEEATLCSRQPPRAVTKPRSEAIRSCGLSPTSKCGLWVGSRAPPSNHVASDFRQRVASAQSAAARQAHFRHNLAACLCDNNRWGESEWGGGKQSSPGTGSLFAHHAPAFPPAAAHRRACAASVGSAVALDTQKRGHTLQSSHLARAHGAIWGGIWEMARRKSPRKLRGFTLRLCSSSMGSRFHGR